MKATSLLSRLAFAVPVFVLVAGCAATAPAPGEVITVEGSVSRRGNVPFTALMLETPEHNLYILTFDEKPAPQLSVSYRYRITGRLYKDDWNSRPFAHLRVIRVERIE
ncbi:hypothetical protein [Rhodocaloribacter sp.]